MTENNSKKFEASENNFDYGKLHHLTDLEAEEAEGGIAPLLLLGLVLGGSFTGGVGTGYVINKKW